MQIAKTILAQLGGNRFLAMTGAKNLVGSDNSLAFDLPRTRDFVKGGINKVRIVLTDRDDYTVEFYKVRPRNIDSMMEPVRKVEGVYVDNLREVFTAETGLETSL